ncbi:helix-turn-helix transcriptional regulator [bacterium]|jgi:putative transcriptional regulator|nr:helix-turn-helix transcriptional regulator [bacterium]MBU1936267.1 helix-turn-helix transcriptional regulator [bacterium]
MPQVLPRTYIRRRLNGDGDFNRDRIRELRTNLNMTQENFAHEIGVTFATVNRWENGRTTPNRVAQKVLQQMEKKLRKMQRT